eukprot:7837265-Pyramimonas_sp.AAC.1
MTRAAPSVRVGGELRLGGPPSGAGSARRDIRAERSRESGARSSAARRRRSSSRPRRRCCRGRAGS